jgi:hypothetical protein
MEFRDFGHTTTIPICHWILKCNRDQIHGLNLVLANKVNLKEIHYMVIYFKFYFFANIFLTEKWEISQSEFLIGCGAQLAYQAAPKILDEELFFSILQEPSKSSEHHKLVPSAILG